MHELPAPRPRHLFWPVLLAALIAAALTLAGFARQLPGALWLQAVLAPDAQDMRQLILHFSVLPRIVTAWLCGYALALAGTVLQQALRNPLAEPGTLGIASGAQLALVLCSLFAPGLLSWGREWPALAGALLAAGLVIGLAARQAFSPIALILGGLVISLCFGAFGAAMTLFNHDYLMGLFIWGSGSLGQLDWSAVRFMTPYVVFATLALALLARPLALLGLEDSGAKSLGLNANRVRIVAVLLAVLLSAVTVAAVGVISFVGLAAPTLARLLGARRLQSRLIWAPLIGAVLLWLTDQIVLRYPMGYREIPTGIATALLGAPLLIWLLPQLRPSRQLPVARTAAFRPLAKPRAWMGLGCLLLASLIGVALFVGQGPAGWQWADNSQWQGLLALRAPRVCAAVAAGVMLALAGLYIQRLTGNPMASPEVLGISEGAAMAVIALTFLVSAPERGTQLLVGALGALLMMAVLFALNVRAHFVPERVLLSGIAITTVFSVVVTVLLSSGDPRMVGLLSWMSGSTYQVSAAEAVLAVACCLVLASLTPLLLRWLELLPMGSPTAQALGVNIGLARVCVLVMVALLSAAATLIIGPLSFVGLMAPHIARLLGLRSAAQQALGAMLVGALIMVIADWLGRNLIYPFQIPAGLFATCIGCPYFIWLMRKA
ncbi:Fe(3+)-hydroxamate ABC transporter permease FhuB [Pseudomonas sp. TE3610]